MSYTSHSVLARSAKLSQVAQLVSLLGYEKYADSPIPNQVGNYYWYVETDYRSYVGVELQIYRTPAGQITVQTRSRDGRSYWDLLQQNKSIKLIRDHFGGHFHTDAGRNRYWRREGPPPSPLASGCFIARWRFNNVLMKANIYLDSRNLVGDMARDKPSGLFVMDDMNPRLISNNLLLPYIVAVWEHYFRSTFAAALKYTAQRESALKRARLSHDDLEKVAVGTLSMEKAVAEAFSFQHPKAIAENFKLLDPKLDLGAAFRKPYRKRKMSLFDSIGRLVEDRHEFVHTGNINHRFFDDQIRVALSDITVAVNRAYEYIAKHYGFVPSHDY